MVSLMLKTSRFSIADSQIDDAVRRILLVKFTLGLFEHPYVDASKADAAVLGADTDLAQQAADESQVLLRNDGNVLPISPSAKKIVVAGSYADDLNDQVGGWTVGWQGVPAGVTAKPVTVGPNARWGVLVLDVGPSARGGFGVRARFPL